MLVGWVDTDLLVSIVYTNIAGLSWDRTKGWGHAVVEREGLLDGNEVRLIF